MTKENDNQLRQKEFSQLTMLFLAWLNRVKMMKNRIGVLLMVLLLVAIGTFLYPRVTPGKEDAFITYIVDPQRQDIRMYFKDDRGARFKSIANLKHWLQEKNQILRFAMNGGMYQRDGAPQGLFIENGKHITSLDTGEGSGNFYLKPNGVFYMTPANTAAITPTPDFSPSPQIKYATQSGPMLVINGALHPAFKKGSANLNIRNGVGILPHNKVVFAMSKSEISFYDFAAYFQRLGCKNALYLDGLVSRTYLPQKGWVQTDGDFGVIIGVSEPAKR